MTESLGRPHGCHQYRVGSEGYMVTNIEALEHPRSECLAMSTEGPVRLSSLLQRA
jgi:hypothetical protein